MATSTETTKTAETSLAKDILNAAWYYLGGRRGLIILTVMLLVAAAALNWSWLVAAGIAPLLLVLAPCAVMCGLGLCGSKMGGKSCSTQSSSADENVDMRSSATDLKSETPEAGDVEQTSVPLTRDPQTGVYRPVDGP